MPASAGVLADDSLTEHTGVLPRPLPVTARLASSRPLHSHGNSR